MHLSTASNTRRLMLAALLAGSAVLAGCAGMRSVSSEVSSFGEWPDGRAAGTYAFERLPSQQAQAAETEMLENAARPALEKAGFKPAAADQQPEVLVQVGARDSRFVTSPWDDPLWWRGGFGTWRGGPWMSPRWNMSMRYDFPRYESQVALLLRDRATGKPLYETRAATETGSRADAALYGALFQASLMDFPRLGMNPRRVVVELPPSP
jgi:predicted small secreted protein